jgi:predicted negative regulator of RcsB-dependent stress response
MKLISMELDEHEQGEVVRKWLRQNGSSLITGILLGLACIVGWNWWQGKTLRAKDEAAAQYSAYSEAVDAKDEAKIKAFAAVITDKYADTPYMDLLTMRQAEHLQSLGKNADAVKVLDAGAARTKDASLKEIFALRAARAMLDDGKAAEASKRVDAIATPLDPAIAFELRGDIQTALGRRDDARKAYEKAMTSLDQASPLRRLVELKLIDAGGTPPAQPET